MGLLRRGTTTNGRRILSEYIVDMAVDSRQQGLATEGAAAESFPGRAFGLLGEVICPRYDAAGLASWGGTAGTYFGVHVQHRYAFVFLAQSWAAPKVKRLFENTLCSELS